MANILANISSAVQRALMDIKRRVAPRGTISQILRTTPQNRFDRSKDLSTPRYVGFRFDFEEAPTPGGIINWIKRMIGNTVKVVYVSLYFSQRSSATNKNYIVILRVPYRQDP